MIIHTSLTPRPRRRPAAPPPADDEREVLARLPATVAVLDRAGEDGTLRHPVAWVRLVRRRALDSPGWHLAWRLVGPCPYCGVRGHEHPVGHHRPRLGDGPNPYRALGTRQSHCAALPPGAQAGVYCLVPAPLAVQPRYARALDAAADADMAAEAS